MSEPQSPPISSSPKSFESTNNNEDIKEKEELTINIQDIKDKENNSKENIKTPNAMGLNVSSPVIKVNTPGINLKDKEKDPKRSSLKTDFTGLISEALTSRISQLSIRNKVESDIIVPPISRLDDLCVSLIAENYYDYPILDKIPPQYLDSIITLLNPNLISIENAAKYIETELFWKRMCLERWKNCEPDKHGSSWKRLYLELNLQELLENFPLPPNENTLPLELENIQLQYSKLKVILPASRSFITTIQLQQFPAHLNLYELFNSFPNLSTLKLAYGGKKVGMEYDSNIFGMKLTDVASLSQLISTTHTINRIVVTESNLDDECMQILMTGLSKNETITALDLSHNKISDMGAKRIAKVLEGFSVLTTLSLADNNIHSTGAKFLANSLSTNRTLSHLDLKMNALQDEGGKALFDSLKQNSTLQVLNISANQMGSEAGVALQEMIECNTGLQDLDVSCNSIANEADDKRLKAAVLNNPSLTKLDLRKNDVLPETIDELNKVLHKRELQLKQERRKALQQLSEKF